MIKNRRQQTKTAGSRKRENGRKQDIRLHFTEKGEGMPLILLHGNGEDGTYFVNQIRYFSRWFRVIAVDTRGHGKTPRGKAPFTIRQFAEDLHEFMLEQKLEKADILGFSDGGNIALVFALRYPEQVNRLIINGANLDPDGVVPSVQRHTEKEYKRALFLAKFSRRAKRKAELLGLMVNDPNIKPEELKKITAKTLVIAGTKDMIKASHTRLIYENLPNARLSFVPGSHFIAAKSPDAFNREVEEFLLETL